MTLHAYLLVALGLFSTGIYAAIERRSTIAILIGIELMLGGASLNFMAFNRFLAPDPAVGQIIVLFIIGLAAAEIAIAISILLAYYWSMHTTDIKNLTDLKG
jgi:NADH:ubiquinone oxidoreductase subunit K